MTRGEQFVPDIHTPDAVPPNPTVPPTGDKPVEREFTIKAMTQRELVTRRFFRHRGAMGGLLVFLFVVLLSFTSIGYGPLPGWWDQSYEAAGTVQDGGRMSLDALPWVDGDGMSLGEHPFGQDDVGRDYFALTMRGTQISLTIAFIVGLIATTIGVLVGATSGFFGGRLENVLMRLTDLVITIPALVIAAVVGRASGGGPLVLAHQARTLVCLGSKASRRPSPMKLTDRAIAMMNRPGHQNSHGRVWKADW